MALMHHKSRNASVRTVTPSQLYELPQQELEALMQSLPELKARLQQSDSARQKALRPSV
jgi:CRP-like cAMP-binding protein